MNYPKHEQLHDLEEEVMDAEKHLKEAKVFLEHAQDDVESCTVQFAEAIIALDEFKKKHNL